MGAFVLSTGLLIGTGGAGLAWADDDGVSSAKSQGVDGVSQATATTATATVSDTKATKAEPTTTQSATPSATTASSQTQGTTSPTTAQTTIDDAAGAAALADDPSPSTASPTSSAAASTGSTGGSSASSTPAPTSTVPATTFGTNSTPSGAGASAATSPKSLATALEPVRTAAVRLAQSVQGVETALTSLHTSPTPITDVIESVQEMLSSVAGTGAALSQLPSDIYALFGFPEVEPRLIGEAGALDAIAPEAGAAAPLFGSLVQTAAPAVVSADAPLFGVVVQPPAGDPAAVAPLSRELSSLSGTAPLAPASVSPPSARSILDHVVSAVLVPASLTALAALALPGIGGLLIVCAAGVRVGYRQAKAAFLMRTSGIARFAGSGPLGVVRSGSLIALHPRTAKADRARSASTVVAQATPPARRHLERVA